MSTVLKVIIKGISISWITSSRILLGSWLRSVALFWGMMYGVKALGWFAGESECSMAPEPHWGQRRVDGGRVNYCWQL
jgi:hypothetical protein